MSKVLVTGASGFIGAHLCEALTARGDEVTCLVRKTSNVERLEPYPVRLAYGDVTDRESLREPIAGQEIVFHLAGCLRATRTAQFYEVNEGGAANVAGLCAQQAEPPVLVLVTSLAAVGPSPDGKPLREGSEARPVSHYGRSKRAAERAAAAVADRVPVTVVRPSAVFGEGDPASLEMFRPIARFGVHLYPVWPRLGVSMIHAADLVAVLVLAAQRGKRIGPASADNPSQADGFYFAACGEYPMYDELGRMMSDALGRRWVLALPAPSEAVWALGMVNELLGKVLGRPLMFNLDKAREATAGRWFCSPQTAIDELGFALPIPLSGRLCQTADWYRREGWL